MRLEEATISTNIQRQSAEELADELDRLAEHEDQLVQSRITWLLLTQAFMLICGYTIFRFRYLVDIASDFGAWLSVAVLATGYLTVQAYSYYRTASASSRKVHEVRERLRSALAR
jgi:hypothetical protein